MCQVFIDTGLWYKKTYKVMMCVVFSRRNTVDAWKERGRMDSSSDAVLNENKWFGMFMIGQGLKNHKSQIGTN